MCDDQHTAASTRKAPSDQETGLTRRRRLTGGRAARLLSPPGVWPRCFTATAVVAGNPGGGSVATSIDTSQERFVCAEVLDDLGEQ